MSGCGRGRGRGRLAALAIVRRATAAACAFALGLLLTPAGMAQQPGPAQGEIDHLLAFVEFSGCEFKRNGSWYPATQAHAHLREKLQMQNSGKPILTAEEFIVRVATRSAFTNIAYQRRCADGVVTDVSSWLSEELLHFRRCRSAQEPCVPLLPG